MLFLYRYVLKQPLGDSIEAVRAKQSKHLPTVLTTEEVQRVLQRLEGTHQLLAKLLYGSGLRVKEGLRLRVKDVDFGQSQIIVRNAKGNRDRMTILPQSITALLQAHLVQVKQLHFAPLAARGTAGALSRFSIVSGVGAADDDCGIGSSEQLGADADDSLDPGAGPQCLF